MKTTVITEISKLTIDFRSPNILNSICFSLISIDIRVTYAQGHKFLALNLFTQFVQHFRTEI